MVEKLHCILRWGGWILSVSFTLTVNITFKIVCLCASLQLWECLFACLKSTEDTSALNIIKSTICQSWRPKAQKNRNYSGYNQPIDCIVLPWGTDKRRFHGDTEPVFFCWNLLISGSYLHTRMNKSIFVFSFFVNFSQWWHICWSKSCRHRPWSPCLAAIEQLALWKAVLYYVIKLYSPSCSGT